MYVKVGYITHAYKHVGYKHITTHHAGMYSLKINYPSHNCVVPEGDYDIHTVLHYM